MSSSDAKGGPLSVDRDIGGPYCEMSSSRHVHTDVADLDVTLYTKGYLLRVLMTFVCHVVCCDVLPRAIWYVSR